MTQKLPAPPVGTEFTKENVEFLLKRYELYIRCHIYNSLELKDIKDSCVEGAYLNCRRNLPWMVAGRGFLDRLFERDAQLPIAIPEVGTELLSLEEVKAFKEQYPHLASAAEKELERPLEVGYSDFHFYSVSGLPTITVPFVRPEPVEEPTPVADEPLKAFLFTVEARKDGKLFQLSLWEMAESRKWGEEYILNRLRSYGFEDIEASIHETLALPSPTESSVTPVEASNDDDKSVTEYRLTEEELTALIKETVYLEQKIKLLEEWLNQCTPPDDEFKNKMFKLKLDSVNLALKSIQNQS